MAADDLTIVLADDQELVRAGFRVILESEPGLRVVGEAADGAQAVDAVVRLRPDVVCLDVQMPGVDGLEAARRIAALDDPPAVLVLTTFDHDDALFQALEAGASGFLLKNASPERLIEAVRTVAAGDALLAPDVTRRVISRATATPALGSSRRPVASASAAVTAAGLTERETEVLRLLARGLSNAEIARELFVGDATVKTHVSNVLQKLALRDRIQAVVWAFEQGVAG
ncbi:DNA-binding NarL/FixJ family response regulator [Curtobacterium luteum]|uniref:DNA-binding NarL/FixJ family response regulator n=1 Tax=Curtobacterium luteum TaxID=33881 RepID=A0A8H9GAQ9_9MICO|nr:response regulator transcription factor [Curtobacterium luteum]MBM7802636.1 DNA-binding NarL/FixJ family response regulator [Curtobacterium luteum]NUU49643.1 response regulator transcription factor [Curtobacterium luteum]GGL10225.1 DNA-binding response regulator [Curtobacterium luteum]